MAEKTAKRLRVQRLEEWDSARYSIIPADAWADNALTLVHLRVLAAIGRVNTQLGWCEFSQTAFAKLVGNGRQAVSGAVNDLVRWRYVEMKGQKRTRSAVCHYRILIDDPMIEAEAEHLERGFDLGAPEGDVSPVDDTPPGGDVSPQDDTGVASGRHGCRLRTTRPLYRARAREIRDQRSLPQPHGARATGLKTEALVLKGKADELIAGLRADRAPDGPVEHLLRPILEQRRFSAADRHGELMRLARSAKALPSPALKKAAEIVLGLGIATIKPQRIADAIEKVRRGGAMVVIRRGTAQFQRWQEHFSKAEPRQALVMARQDTWQVPSEWPPSARASGNTGRDVA